MPLLNKGHKLFRHLEESPGLAVDLVEAGEGCFFVYEVGRLKERELSFNPEISWRKRCPNLIVNNNT